MTGFKPVGALRKELERHFSVDRRAKRPYVGEPCRRPHACIALARSGQERMPHKLSLIINEGPMNTLSIHMTFASRATWKDTRKAQRWSGDWKARRACIIGSSYVHITDGGLSSEGKPSIQRQRRLSLPCPLSMIGEGWHGEGVCDLEYDAAARD